MSNKIIGLVCLAIFAGNVQAQPVGLEFYDNLSSLPYIDDKGEHVIFEEDGPGCVYNLWFTGSGRNLHWGKIRFYFDNEKTPRIEYEAREFFSGLHRP
jgi:hypothetical protein